MGEAIQMSHNDAANNLKDTHAYLVGGGVASLAAAVLLVRDAGVPGKNIHVFEQDVVNGGCLDGSGSRGAGYVCRGGRMFEEHYVCSRDCFSSIPSATDPTRSVWGDIILFNREVVSNAQCRLLRDCTKVDVSSYGLRLSHLWDMLLLTVRRKNLTNRTIQDWFSPSFFKTNFWLLWATTFSFQPWHNVGELRRYFLRFIQFLPGFNELKNVFKTRYNQYDCMIAPTERWLKNRGVVFHAKTKVSSIDFSTDAGQTAIRAISYAKGGSRKKIELTESDYCFITLGSMVESSTRGSMKIPPPEPPPPEQSATWSLWTSIARNRPDYGNPDIFTNRIPQTHWVSFTVTQTEPVFFMFMEHLTGNIAGTGGLVSIMDSNWFLSIVLVNQPHFLNQPENVLVLWGYGLYPDNTGNFVKKKMRECSGEEILVELLSHLKIADQHAIIKHSNCIPTMMPYITSQFMTYRPGDRPPVIPAGAANFAIMGQYCEIPDDVVFTVEYSVRSAATAVYGLLNVQKTVPPVYKGQRSISVLWNALKALLR